MAKKKNTASVSASQEESVQAQEVLAKYHEIAFALHASSDQAQAEAALAEINALSAGAQLALLKELSVKEKHKDAADILTAVYELSPLKDVRKEARRSLIRLEAARIYPSWQPPIERPPAPGVVSTAIIGPMRFWRGIVTDSLDIGEIQLILAWEQGDDFRNIRVMGFLLDYAYAGVKDFFSRVESKNSFERYIERMKASMPDVAWQDCSLADGRRFLLDALAVNERRNTTPHRDYRLNLSLIKEQVLDAVPDVAADDHSPENDVDRRALNPETVVINFIEAWVRQDYGAAYNYLAREGSLRAGLAKDEWVKVRKDWAAQARPANLQPGFSLIREPKKGRLWLPHQFQFMRRETDSKEVETGWSIELSVAPSSGTLPELPEATTMYEETKRYWFWSSYTLVRENAAWHIQSMTDEGLNAQNLSIEELRKRIQDLDMQSEKAAKKLILHKKALLDEEKVERQFEEISYHVSQSIYYYDILIKKSPLDPAAYEEALAHTALLQDHERSMGYLLWLARNVPEKSAERYRHMGSVGQLLVQKMDEEDNEERAELYGKLAIAALRKALAIENSFDAHISLAELLMRSEELAQMSEAEDHLQQARSLATNAEEQAHIEMHLGEIASERSRPQDALAHYQRTVELQPESAEHWVHLADTHRELEHDQEAEASYKRAIELEPDNDDYYSMLSVFYAGKNQPERAVQALKDGLDVNPDSVPLQLYLAAQDIENGNYREAKFYLDKAERLRPDFEMISMLRQVLAVKQEPDQPSMPLLAAPDTTPNNKSRRRNRGR